MQPYRIRTHMATGNIVSPLQLALPNYDQGQAYFGVNPPSTERMWNPPRDRVPYYAEQPAGYGTAMSDSRNRLQQNTEIAQMTQTAPSRSGPPLISAPLGVAAQMADAAGTYVQRDASLDTLTSLSRANASLHQQALEADLALQRDSAAQAAQQAQHNAQRNAMLQQQVGGDAITGGLADTASSQRGEPDMVFWIGLVLALIAAEYFLSRRVN